MSGWRFWQSFQGRRLRELFESHASGEEVVKGVGFRLLAEIPKAAHCEGSLAAPGQGLIVVDLPDRVRIFEDDPSPAAETVPAAETIPPASCPNCQEESRAFLEEFFRTSGIGEITQVGHSQAELCDASEARAFPNVSHSKIETTVVTYPLKDLVLLDDGGRPVFDTCTIIDHLQSAVAPESWSHPSVSIQLDQQSVSLVIRQTREVHEKVQSHLHYLRRLQVKQICNLIEHMSQDSKAIDGPAKQQPSLGTQVPPDLGGLPTKLP